MDRLNQLREAGSSRDSSFDTSSPPSESYETANETSSKYFSLSEVDTTFDITPMKETSLASTAESEQTITDTERLISNLSPIGKKNDHDNYKIGKQIEAANILSGGVDIFDDNENSYDGNELVIDDNATSDMDDKSNSQKSEDNMTEATLVDTEGDIPSRDMEVVLQIDGNNVDAIDIGNGLYLYRKEGKEELAAVQIIDDDQQQPSFKFLKVRENAEGNLEVYEEIEVEVPKEAPIKEEKGEEKNTPHVPIKDINKVISDPTSNKVAERKNKSPQKESLSLTPTQESDSHRDSHFDSKTEVNFNGKTMKFSEARKSPLIGSFTPMAYHSTPNKEGIPLTKTMVDQQLHPNRHSDNVKKTIEVHTDISKQKHLDTPVKIKDVVVDGNKSQIIQDRDEKKNELIEKSDITGENKVTGFEKNTTKTHNIVDESVVENGVPKELLTITTVKGNDNKDLQKDETVIETVPDNQKTSREIVSVSENQNKEENDIDIIKVGKLEAVEESIHPNDTIKEKPYGTCGIKDSSSAEEIKIVDDKSSEILDDRKPKEHPKITPEDTNIETTSSSQLYLDEESGRSINTPVHMDERSATAESHLRSEADSRGVNSTNVETSQPTVPKEQDKSQNIDKNTNKPVIDVIDKDVGKTTTEIKTDTDQNADIKLLEKIDMKPDNIIQVLTQNKTDISDKEASKAVTDIDTKSKPINNHHAAVPFGKWTEANRQEFLNKIKESKVPSSSNSNQIKQPNDLNRRDVLKKIDSQRQSNNAAAKSQDFSTLHKLNVKHETPAFTNKTSVDQKNKNPLKVEASIMKNKPALNKKVVKQESVQKTQDESSSTTTITNVAKKESIERKEINNQDLIDKTIEGIINRAIPTKAAQEDTKQNTSKDKLGNQKSCQSKQRNFVSKNTQQTSLDDIEMKMNELHGIPFIERPPHELPKVHNQDVKSYSKHDIQKVPTNKVNKIPNLLPLPNKIQQKIKDDSVDIDSEEEIIEHEPITGDIELNEKNIEQPKLPLTDKTVPETVTSHSNVETAKKESIITENDFDKFVRRNSITYENYLTVNFDAKDPHNVVQTVKEKDVITKKYTRNEILLAEAKAKSPHNKHQNNHPIKISSAKFAPASEDVYNKQCQSKFQIAYQSALTAKRQLECPITIIEDKPVKVVYVDSNAEFVPSQLNVAGQVLSPAKKQPTDSDVVTVSTCGSVDSDILDAIEDKLHDETKIKTKHQRKQVLTPVETPELELIEPSDLGIQVSPKKKRKTDESKFEKNSKSLKSYLLGRSPDPEDNVIKPQEPIKIREHEGETLVSHKNTVSAIDNLVKAAELIENQSENLNTSINIQNTSSQQNSPVKRGRGRPRKYPLPEGATDKDKDVNSQKKPRLIDPKETKNDSTEEDTSDDEIIKENWTMGKINENIVCPICNKLFRSENVVFKHVKHCTGPSPNRSDSDKRSPRRLRQSYDSETKSPGSQSEDIDIDTERSNTKQHTSRQRKSKDFVVKSVIDNKDIVLIDDTPLKQKPQKNEEETHKSNKTLVKHKVQHRTNNLVCEICGKIFRQLSYLVSHKLQHKKQDTKKPESANKNVFSCDICKKEFRKLHHLVQHRIIHNPNNTVPSKLLRKSSFESNNKSIKHQVLSKSNDDQSAGFRCEPCDKSFRKLHHLVEHRETHDGINRQKNTSTTQTNAEKITPPPQCDICKKTFRKLHHLIEHKEQHLDTSSEKSDDKSVKSSLSTKDIIHECPLCYMVFPNEHSLNKHHIICQRKKRQSAAKAAKQAEENKILQDSINVVKPVENKHENEDPKPVIEEKKDIEKIGQPQEILEPPIPEKPKDVLLTPTDNKPKGTEIATVEPQSISTKKDMESEKPKAKTEELPVQIKKTDKNVQDTPKKKTSVISAETVVKRRRTANLPLPVIDDVKPSVELSDDDEVRYMFNPDFVNDDGDMGKRFMKIRAKKRNSLQIERPTCKDIVKRRSIQQPLKIPRLKPKPVEPKIIPTNTATLKNVAKSPKVESVPFTDSDDSDIKYSFPKTIPDKRMSKTTQESASKDSKKKNHRNSLAEKRKPLVGIAKRKSLGLRVPARNTTKSSPVKPLKKRSPAVEHRCDCGQLFSSAALLSRHTTLAHTPPRIRRRRSPPPENVKPPTKPTRKSSSNDKIKPDSRKSSVKSDVVVSKQPKSVTSTRKSSANKSSPKTPCKSVNKNDLSQAEKSSKVKLRRNTAHRGVPVPEKMKKIGDKLKDII